jgi:hypothetical protein
MCGRGVLVHCPSRLGAAVAALVAELLVTEYLQSGHLNILKPFIIVTV